VSQRPITEEDLLRFLVGKCDDDVRQRIADERKILSSEVQLWFADLDAKLDDPLNVDWAEIGFMHDDADEDDDAISVVERELLAMNVEIMTLVQTGEYTTALEKAQQLRDRAFATLGDRPPYFTMALNALATVYFNQGQYEEAGVFSRECARLERESQDGDPVRCALALAMVAESHRAIGEVEQAATVANEAVQIMEDIPGERGWQYGSALMIQAGCHFDLGKYLDAQAGVEEAIALLQQSSLAPEVTGQLTSGGRNLLGMILRERGLPMDGMGPLADALEWAKVALGREHPVTAQYTANLAACFMDIQDFNSAEKGLIGACDQLRKLMGPCPQLVIVLNNLGALYLTLDRNDLADEALQQAVECIDDLGGVPMNVSLLVRHNVGVLLQRIGRFDEAMTELEPVVKLLYGRRRAIAEENLERIAAGIRDGVPIAV